MVIGTATDPYQRAEGRYRLMPGVLRALHDALETLEREQNRKVAISVGMSFLSRR